MPHHVRHSLLICVKRACETVLFCPEPASFPTLLLASMLQEEAKNGEYNLESENG